jgi:hypothetical protein
MRADSHYVDLLEARSSESRGRSSSRAIEDEPDVDAARPRHLSERDESATVRAVPPDPTLHAGRDLAQSLTTLSACADLLSGSPSELSRAVVGNLIRAEAWRASTLLQATRIVRQELPVARMPVAILGVLDQVVQGFMPERRIRAVAVDSQSTLTHGSFMAGDERMLAGALSGAVLATLALLDGVQNARVVISAALDGHELTFAVSQDLVAAAPLWHSRAFDAQWTDRPGGVPALVCMLAVEETARAHGGSASAGTLGRGTTVSLSLPLGV